MKILVISGSSRDEGNTETLTDIVVQGLPVTKVALRSKTVLPIVDKRHTPDGFSPVQDDYDEIIKEVLAHDAVIFATPIYWYGMSGHMKNFVDRWSQSLRDDRYDFRNGVADKPMYVVTVGGDAPRVKGLPLIQQFHYIFDFVGAKFAGYIIGEGGRPGEILNDKIALHDAQCLNEALLRQM